MAELSEFLSWCFIPFCASLGGLIALIWGEIPISPKEKPALRGLFAQILGLLLFVQLPAATWIFLMFPALKWQTIATANALALFFWGVWAVLPWYFGTAIRQVSEPDAAPERK